MEERKGPVRRARGKKEAIFKTTSTQGCMYKSM